MFNATFPHAPAASHSTPLGILAGVPISVGSMMILLSLWGYRARCKLRAICANVLKRRIGGKEDLSEGASFFSSCQKGYPVLDVLILKHSEHYHPYPVSQGATTGKHPNS